MQPELNQQNKSLVWEFWRALEDHSPDKPASLFINTMTQDVLWHGPDPINELQGNEAWHSDFWLPFLRSFPDLKRKTHIFCGGQSNGRVDGNIELDGHMWVSGTGYFNATFESDYLGIPATGKTVNIRWGEFCRIKNNQIAEIYFLIDLIDLMQQSGIRVLPPVSYTHLTLPTKA